jgi:hypothetical protein
MAFLHILKTKAERDFELKSKIRQANNKIDSHVRKLVIQCQKYLFLARRAFDLQDQRQFAELALRYHQAISARNRWQRYQLKLDAMELQRDEVRATEDFLSGIGALTQAILRGIRPDDVQRLAQDIELAENKRQEIEQALDTHMHDVLEPVNNSWGFEAHVPEALATEMELPSNNLPESSAVGVDPGNTAVSRFSKMSFDEALRYYAPNK